MKKGTILSILLIISIVSAFCISRTYAKYTSEFKGSDTARVAEWKVGMQENIDILGILYDTEEEDFEPGNKLNHKKEEDVFTGAIAPGSYGEYRFTISADTETSYKIDFDFTGSKDDTDGRITYYWNGMPMESFDKLKDSIKHDLGYKHNPGWQPGYNGDSSIENEPVEQVIGFVWNYEDDDDADTKLGIRAAQGENLEVKLVVKVTINQVD